MSIVIHGCCKDCKWYDSATERTDALCNKANDYSERNYGDKKLPDINSDQFGAVDAEHYFAAVVVGGNFGCIHFEGRCE